jgi:uncharacterized protein (DUF4415 family)
MKKEYDLRQLKVKRRGPRIPANAKIMKTIRLDADVLAWLMSEASGRGIGYQTLLNMLLREAMAGGGRPREDLRSEIRRIVRDEIRRAS